jgi:RiboL-PSP-HEPN
MPDTFDSPVEEFNADLARLEQLCHLLQSLRDFGGLADPQASVDEFIGAATRLRLAVRAQRTDFPLLTGALLLYLAGRFEYFVRACFEALAGALADKCQRFSDLPEKMQAELLRMTGEALRNPSRYGFDDIEVRGFISNLAGNLAAETGIGTINTPCLSVTDQNIWPDTLADLFKRIGVTKLWEDIGKQSAMKVHCEIEAEPQVSREAKSRLARLMTERNQIAHPTGTVIFPDTDRLAAHMRFLRILAQVLADICRVQIAVFPSGS